jgi:hypothetical protein
LFIYLFIYFVVVVVVVVVVVCLLLLVVVVVVGGVVVVIVVTVAVVVVVVVVVVFRFVIPFSSLLTLRLSYPEGDQGEGPSPRAVHLAPQVPLLLALRHAAHLQGGPFLVHQSGTDARRTRKEQCAGILLLSSVCVWFRLVGSLLFLESSLNLLFGFCLISISILVLVLV